MQAPRSFKRLTAPCDSDLTLHPFLVLCLGKFATFIQMLHQISGVLCLQKRIHRMDNQRDVLYCLCGSQALFKEMCVHAVSGFAYLVQDRFVCHLLGLLPMAKCIMGNPVSC